MEAREPSSLAIDREFLLSLKPVGEQQELQNWASRKHLHSLWSHKLLSSSREPIRRNFCGGRVAGIRFEIRMAFFSANPHQFTRPHTSKENTIPTLELPHASFPRLGLLNARSFCKRKHNITDLFASSGLDFLAITENGFNVTHGDHILRSACPPGYTSLHVPHPVAIRKRGGGVGLIFNVFRCHPTSFELLCASVRSSTKAIRLFVIYRPPERPGYPPFSTFLVDFRTRVSSRP